MVREGGAAVVVDVDLGRVSEVEYAIEVRTGNDVVEIPPCNARSPTNSEADVTFTAV